VASVDRFSAEAATLMVRDATNGLPAANAPIDFDAGAPFITHGLGPGGELVSYYNFDVQPTHTAPIYALFREGSATPVSGQLNIIDVVPGDSGYSDFWHVNKVTVPSDYVANTITSAADVMSSGYAIERTDLIVNCPVVPDGSTATMRYGGGNAALVRGWYQGQVVYYFDFSEKELHATPPASGDLDVPLSDIYVAFNVNPDEEGGGPPSGFMTEAGSDRTHNVLETLPSDDAYSPLWLVNIYDNADFDSVGDLSSAQEANILETAAATVNCPIVSVEE
jgi:hypothetical protein